MSESEPVDLNTAVSFVYHGGTQWFDPVQLTPGAVLQLSRSRAVRESLVATLKQLTPDDYLSYCIGYLEHGQRVMGDAWDFTDLRLALSAATNVLRASTYLEIGVRRGHSMAAVASQAPHAAIWGLDLWIENYAGIENPGPEFVHEELRRVGHRGPLQLISGDSRETLPALLAERSDLLFDLVTVDGDHSYEGAKQDLVNIMPRVRPGGVIVFDDIAHPEHTYLADCWRETVGANSAFRSTTYSDLGYGIAVGVRKARG
jgi:predicted O-methyltransferase YrrM